MTKINIRIKVNTEIFKVFDLVNGNPRDGNKKGEQELNLVICNGLTRRAGAPGRLINKNCDLVLLTVR